MTCLCPNAVNTGMLGRNEDDETQSRRRGDAVSVNIGEIVEPEQCAQMTLEAMESGRFLVLPHPRVGQSFLRKATDYDRWLESTNRRLRRMRGEQGTTRRRRDDQNLGVNVEDKCRILLEVPRPCGSLNTPARVRDAKHVAGHIPLRRRAL